MSEDKQIRIDKVRELLREKGDSPWPGDKENTANVIGEYRQLSEPLSDVDAKRRMSAMSRRGFLVGGVAALAGLFGWRWMNEETKAALFRRTFELNEGIGRSFYRPSHLAPEFPSSAISPDRVNGMEGLEDALDAALWRLTVSGLTGITKDLTLTLDDIKKLPRTEMTTELKCIEGWSVIVNWAGVRFSDLASHLMQNKTINDLPKYVSLTTPDEKYFVGWDLPSILHAQTLLAYEMNGAPLTPEHGAPLRLASPTKYGIKQIKRIGRIEFTDQRPKDFWADPQYGYDWYAGL